MIPKVIHYCWFGGNPKSTLMLKCIESWKKFLPDYEIKEWNETNCDLSVSTNLREAYNDGNYSFVSNYFRFDALYKCGGIYFDTDVEIIKDMTPILEKESFGGIDTTGGFNSGIGVGGKKGLEIFKIFRDEFKNVKYERNKSSFAYLSKILNRYGFDRKSDKIQVIAGLIIYPKEYFSPLDMFENKLTVTDDTYTIHHFANSWFTDDLKRIMSRKHPKMGEKFATWKYYLAECLIIKDENQYLLEHLTKGIQAGIEHFFIYDNMSEEPVADYLHSTELSSYCTVERWENTEHNQLDCYAHFLEKHRNDAKWCAFIDTDEMFEGDLRKLCKENEDYLSLSIQQVIHGANGHAYADYSKTLTERFQPHILKFQMFKMVVQLDYLKKQFPHHSCIDERKANGIPMGKWLKMIPYNEQCQLHHYFFRSFEEWLKKCLRGNVFAKESGWKLKMFFDENTIPNNDRDVLLKKYDLDIESHISYGAEDFTIAKQ